MKKKLTSLIIAVMMIASLSTAALAANGWSWGQDRAHQAADLVRDVGGLRYAANAALSAYWYSQGGRDTSRDYYYDGYNNTRYYADGRTQNGDSNNLPSGTYIANDGNIVFDSGLSYTDGRNVYYWSTSRGQYYRYTDESGTKKYDGLRTRYASSANYYNGNGTGGGINNDQRQYSSVYTERNYNLTGYDYSYKGIRLYAGRIYGLKDSGLTDRSEAEYLARFVISLAPDVDTSTEAGKQTAAGICWFVLNMRNGNSWQTVINACPDYNGKADLTTTQGKDALEFAHEVLFRKAARDSGMSYFGGILPTNYSFYYCYNDGRVAFRSQSGNASDYSFPNYYSSGKNALHSPY